MIHLYRCKLEEVEKNQRAKSQTSSLKNYKSVRLKYAFLPLNPPILTKNAVFAGFYL